MRHLIIRIALLALTTLLVLASPAAAQATTGDDDNVLVRVSGDVTIDDDDPHGTIVVVDGDLDLTGSATTIVVINGTATLTDATADTLVVISGTANLGPSTTVTGDVQLVNSDIDQDPTATVEGEIRDDADQLFTGFWLIGFLFMAGWAVLTILAALTLAAVAPTLARGGGRTVTAEPAKTIIAGIILWVAVPVVTIVLLPTVVGIPTALAIWVAVLPALGFVGLLVAGVRIGEYLTAEREGHGHPYLAATVGTVILIVCGAIPFIGPLIVALAAFLGSGALVLHAWRAARNGTGPARSIPAPSPADATP